MVRLVPPPNPSPSTGYFPRFSPCSPQPSRVVYQLPSWKYGAIDGNSNRIGTVVSNARAPVLQRPHEALGNVVCQPPPPAERGCFFLLECWSSGHQEQDDCFPRYPNMWESLHLLMSKKRPRPRRAMSLGGRISSKGSFEPTSRASQPSTLVSTPADTVDFAWSVSRRP
jgi:hypothetical protein